MSVYLVALPACRRQRLWPPETGRQVLQPVPRDGGKLVLSCKLEIQTFIVCTQDNKSTRFYFFEH